MGYTDPTRAPPSATPATHDRGSTARAQYFILLRAVNRSNPAELSTSSSNLRLLFFIRPVVSQYKRCCTLFEIPSGSALESLQVLFSFFLNNLCLLVRSHSLSCSFQGLLASATSLELAEQPNRLPCLVHSTGSPLGLQLCLQILHQHWCCCAQTVDLFLCLQNVFLGVTAIRCGSFEGRRMSESMSKLLKAMWLRCNPRKH